MKKIVVCMVLLAALAGGVFSGLALIKPVQRPAEESEAFSAILRDIGEITAVPHTAGSPENYAVRDMIIARAEGLGLTAEVLPFELDVTGFVADYQELYVNGSAALRQRIDGMMEGYPSLEAFARDKLNAGGKDVLQLHNILVKVSGTAPTGAAMFVSHYDHVKGAPGAADDALAVACMLDLMGEMAQNPPQNDVYFLYTDGEENGLLGAADFVATQPQYAEEIDVLFNFEARGNRGAMLMFETSGKDYELVRRFSEAVPQPVTMSIATAIYGMMPNGTDYTEFKNAGYHGLNFAMIEGDETYHQPTDTLENLDKDSAWQYHQTMTALGSHFAGTDLAAIANNQSALYFPLPLIGIVVIPGWLGYALGFLPLALAMLLVILTLRDKEMKGGRKAARITGLALLGLLPAAVMVLFFAGSYLLAIPAALFLLVDLVMGTNENKGHARVWAGLAVLLLAIFISAVLYAPLALLIQVALKYWCVTAILALLPLVPTALYGMKVLRRV